MQRVALTYGDVSIHIQTDDDNLLALDNISRLAGTTIVDLMDEMGSMLVHDEESTGLSHREAMARDYLLSNNDEFGEESE
jgi:hypothetical protein